MPVYGEYETVAELGRNGSTCVYRARPADGGWDLGFDDLGTDSIFALKTFRVRNAEDAGGTETSRFLERVRAQKRVVVSGALHWAPIIDTGKAGAEAYYIAPYYPRTAAKMAAEPGGISAEALYGIVVGTLQGLLELRQNQGRPHGNLKTTNILIKGEGPIAPTDIQLTDPAREEDASIAGEVEDLFNLGEIIHQLVLGAKFAGQHTWPIKPSRRWTQLGKLSDKWLALCNHLLSPRAAENWLRVDDILEDVKALKPVRKRLTARKLWVAAAAMAVVSGLCVGEYFRYASQWRDLCADHAEGVAALSAQLSHSAPNEIAGDVYLQEHVVRALAEARDKNIELDPRGIAGSDQALSELAEHPPMSPGVMWKTQKAWRVVHDVEQSLSPEQWKDLTDLSARRAEYEKRGWVRLNQYAGTLINSAKRPAEGNWAAGIAATVEGRARLVKLDNARATARVRMEHLIVRGQASPVVQDQITEFQGMLRACAESDVILPSAVAADRLTQQLIDIETSSARFDDAVPLLAEAAKRQRAYEVRGWSGPAHMLASFLDRARPDADWVRLTADLNAAKLAWEQVENRWLQIEQRRRLFETSGDRILATYREYITQSHLADQADLNSLARRLQEINDEPAWAAAAKVVAGPEWAKIDVVEFARKSDAHRGFAGQTVATPEVLRLWLSEVEGYGSQLASATIKPDAAHANSGNDALDKWPPVTTVKPKATTVAIVTPKTATTIASVKPEMMKPEPDPAEVRRAKEIGAFITECREVALSAKNGELKEIWRTKNDEYAERVNKDHKAFGPEIRAQRDKLRSRLLQLDSAYQSASAPLALKANAATWSGPLVKALQAATPHRSALLKQIGALADSDDSRFDAAMARLVDDDEQWRAGAARILADAGRVDQLLGQGYFPNDKQSGTSPAISAVRGNELYKIDGVRLAIDPLMKPISVVENETAPGALRLLAAETDLPLGVRLAAWAKIGDQPTKESLAGDLKLGGEILAGVQKKLTDKARVTSIKLMLESEVRHRWETLLEKAAKPEDVEAAIGLRDRITGIDTEKLSPRSRVNLALHDLRASALAAHGDDLEKQIEPAAAKLKQLIGMLDPAEAKQPNLVALAGEIERIGNPAPVDFTHLGPMSDAARDASKVSWSVTAEDSGDKVTYSAALPTDVGKEDVALIFRRVHPGSASQSSWVCTTEASLALFSDLITASGKWSEIRSGKMLADYDPARGDPRVGPRVWEWPRYGRTPGIVRSMVWLGSDFVPSRLDHYPDSIGSEFNRSVIRDERGERSEELNPSRQQPMQQVSVKAAQLAAAAAGCRIPTVAEWQAAWRSADQRAAGNLRDRTWRLELEHMKKPAFGGQIRPDAGMFVPAGEKPSDAVYPRADGSEFSDGVLWFHPVPGNAAGFVDLVGNVAEFVSDEAGKVYVIGGSAMSPPGRALDRPFALGADQSTNGFSDTGFRLAFSGPASGSGKFKDAVAGNWYLVSH